MLTEKTDFCAIVNRLRVHYGLKKISDISGMDFTRLSRISNGDDAKVDYDIGYKLVAEDNRLAALKRRRKQ
jgi:hypothetical protein